MLRALRLVAGLIALAVLVEIAYQLISGARPSISHFGLGFVGHTAWQPNFGRFGAATALFGTLASSAIAMALATPLGIAIAIYLAMLAPRVAVRWVVGPLVEMLAAIPSVIVGFWGVIVLAPFVHEHIEPWLNHALGFIPIFGSPQSTGLSVFASERSCR